MDKKLVSVAYAMRQAMEMDGEQVPSLEELNEQLARDAQQTLQFLSGMSNIAAAFIKQGWTPPVDPAEYEMDDKPTYDVNIIPITAQYWRRQASIEPDPVMGRELMSQAWNHLVNHTHALQAKLDK